MFSPHSRHQTTKEIIGSFEILSTRISNFFFRFRMRFPSTRIQRIRQRIQIFLNPHSTNTLRVDGKLLSPERKSCEFKNIQMRVDGATKKLRRRRRGQSRINNDFIFYLQISLCSKVVYFVSLCQSGLWNSTQR